MTTMIYFAAFMALMTAGIIRTVRETRRLLDNGENLNGLQVLWLGRHLLPYVILSIFLGTGTIFAPARITVPVTGSGAARSGMVSEFSGKGVILIPGENAGSAYSGR